MQNKLDMLRIFNVVSGCSNFREASRLLGTSPQSVTRAIQELERLLGKPLFDRTTRNTQITDFGKSIAAKTEVLVDEFDELFQVNRH